ncbi:malonyl-coenzyme A:anthocyanin 3-O-glucoside-6''-O-malonyltransferase-like [Magnolia sinica]|uniref:malonyl-coenzyme A:anthocyanin 3-O-glucoside-6''-O-malonyltransferase-like n=1 Tax=Magnolia sinica TaxID=86752 RepID=UPI002657C3CF|nr:malonyl-coenzyme A:anthocyanin 3-O-glucoside-6''-O-malonyltransferase-like [Magnolia sinica]
MKSGHTVKVLELCNVSPPAGFVRETIFPLTLFDVSWVQAPPVQRLFFYEFPNKPDEDTTTHFLNSFLSNLKHSLSLTLHLFYPLAGNLTQSPETGDHEIRYVDGDSITLTIAESDADIHLLVQNHPRDIAEFYPLLPELHPSSLMALQVTIFPNTGISIGSSLHHVAADGRSSTHFIKSWSSICRTGDDSLITSHPSYDRTVLADRDWLKRLFLKQMTEFQFEHMQVADSRANRSNMLLATFALSRSEIERLRKRVMDRVAETRNPFHCSAFVLTCAYVLVCLVKARGDDADDKTVHFVFSVDCRARWDPPIPATYFGNCVSGCFAEAKGRDLGSGDGLFVAAEAIGRGIQRLEGGVLEGAETWFPRICSMMGQRVISVAASPKFRVYDTDFGWGKPKKTEVISIEKTDAIYVGDSRDEEGGIEIGLVMPEPEMSVFASLFEADLKARQ